MLSLTLKMSRNIIKLYKNIIKIISPNINSMTILNHPYINLYLSRKFSNVNE